MAKTLSEALTELSSKIIHSKCTISDYYQIGCIKVRVSDHASNSSDCDLAIFCNGKSTYCIIPNIGTWKSITWCTSIKEVIIFITQFEKFAQMLIKPFTPVEREFVPSTSDVYNAWKSRYSEIYSCKKAPLREYLDKLFTLYQSDISIRQKVDDSRSLKTDEKVKLYKKLLGE